MSIAYVMPKLAMAMNEGTVTQWLVKAGERVEKGQQLMAVETEKVAYDCESPEAGYFHIVVAEGETVSCEEVVAYFCESEEELQALAAKLETADAAEVASPSATEINQVPVNEALVTPTSLSVVDGARIKVSPLARKMASMNDLDITRLIGTGPGGRIVKRDIVAALERGVGAAVSCSQVSIVEKARIPLKGMRKTIADRMIHSLQTSAQLSSFWESDITDLLLMRKKFVAREEQLGTRVSVNAFIIKAIACAIKEVPIANSCMVGDDIVVYDNINMGIAISMPGVSEYDSGLMVAVLRNIERMGVVDIDLKMKALIKRVRGGDASANDLSGSTITLSSTAGIAPPGLQTTPVLNAPNAVLLGPSTPQEKPVIKSGEIVARMMMPMSLTFDHRMLNGEPAARFMKAIHEYLECPELMLA